MKSALDTGERLFASRFVLATVVPSTLFVLATVVLIFGVEPIETTVREIAAGGWSRVTLSALVTFGVSLLLAYVLLGSLRTIREVYAGGWPRWPILGWLAEHLANRQTGRFDRLARAEDDARRRMNDAAWPTFLGFEPSGDVLFVPNADVAGALNRLEHDYAALRWTSRGRPASDEASLRVLARARALQSTVMAHPDRFADDEKARLMAVIGRLRAEHDDPQTGPVLTDVVNRLYVDAERAYRQAYAMRRREFPTEPNWIRPTRFGNVLAASETYTLKRYEVDWDTLWPRLLFVLPKSARDRVDAADTALDFALSMSALSLALALVALLVAAQAIMTGASGFLALIAGLGAVLSWWLFIDIAIVAARSLREQAEVAVDLYRLSLLDALQIERPRTPAEERRVWSMLRAFVASEAPLRDLRFVPAPGQASAGRAETKKPTHHAGADDDAEPEDDETAGEDTDDGAEAKPADEPDAADDAQEDEDDDRDAGDGGDGADEDPEPRPDEPARPSPAV